VGKGPPFIPEEKRRDIYESGIKGNREKRKTAKLSINPREMGYGHNRPRSEKEEVATRHP